MPSVQIRTIQLDRPHSISSCRLEMLDWWMKNGEDISWAHIAVALRNMYKDQLAERIVRKYCSRIGMDSGTGNFRKLSVYLELPCFLYNNLFCLRVCDRQWCSCMPF